MTMLFYRRTEQMVHTSRWLVLQSQRTVVHKKVFSKTLKKCLTKIKCNDTLETSQEGDENQPLDDDKTYSLYDGLQPSSVLLKSNTRFHEELVNTLKSLYVVKTFPTIT